MTDIQTTEHAPDIVRASLRGRVLSGALLIIAIALLVAFQRIALPLISVTLQANPPPSEAVRLVKMIFFAMTGICTFSAFILIAYARNILRSKQCPPSNAWLWRDTKVVRGDKAIRYAQSYIAIALIACLTCIGLSAYIATTLDRISQFIPVQNSMHGNGGVIVLPPKTLNAH
jgi:hypothetical protein